jgi:hypothetical protein
MCELFFVVEEKKKINKEIVEELIRDRIDVCKIIKLSFNDMD